MLLGWADSAAATGTLKGCVYRRDNSGYQGSSLPNPNTNTQVTQEDEPRLLWILCNTSLMRKNTLCPPGRKSSFQQQHEGEKEPRASLPPLLQTGNFPGNSIQSNFQWARLPGQGGNHGPGGISQPCGCGAWGHGLAELCKGFSNLNNSMALSSKPSPASPCAPKPSERF